MIYAIAMKSQQFWHMKWWWMILQNDNVWCHCDIVMMLLFHNNIIILWCNYDVAMTSQKCQCVWWHCGITMSSITNVLTYGVAMDDVLGHHPLLCCMSEHLLDVIMMYNVWYHKTSMCKITKVLMYHSTMTSSHTWKTE